MLMLNKFIFLVIVSCVVFVAGLELEGKCITPNGEPAECISIYNCTILLDAIKTLNTTLIKFAKESQCGYDKDPLVCCGTAANFSNVFNDHIPDRRYCGLQHSDEYINSRLIGDDQSYINEFPWLANLIYQDANLTESMMCSGTLVSDRYVLTTASCLFMNRRKLVKVRLGGYNSKQQKDCVSDGHLTECNDPEEFEIAEKIAHPHYSRKQRLHDVGIIRLNRTAQYTDYIRPICLPIFGTHKPKINDTLFQSGWGAVAWHDTSYVKKRIRTHLLPNDACAASYEMHKIILTENHTCTAETLRDNRSVCLGDLGGPVMSSHNNQWYQESIILFRQGCESETPGVNVRLSSYLGWILATIEP